MLLTHVTINEPMTNVFKPGQSILPERFRSISIPSPYSIVSEDLTSISEPSNIVKIVQYDIPIEEVEE